MRGFVFVLALAGCAPKVDNLRALARQDAQSHTDYATLLAFDDDVVFESPERADLRAQRVVDFEALAQAKLAALGPLSDDTAVTRFGVLLALRAETVRATEPSDVFYRSEADVGKERQGWVDRKADLSAVDTRLITPALAETAASIWKLVDAHVARGEVAAAVQLGTSVVDALGPDNPYTARLEAIAKQAAEPHLALARSAGETLPGARVLHARLAEEFGSRSASLGAEPAALLAETALSWTVVSPGSCGDAPLSFYADGVVPLATTLSRVDGFSSGVGRPVTLTVDFDSCPATPRAWETTAETAPFSETKQVEQLVVKTRYTGCMTSTTTGPSTTTTSHGDYYDVVYTNPGATSTTVYGCTPESYTDGETEVVTVTEQRVENYGVRHAQVHMRATGTIRMAFDSGVRELPFTIEADSDDDTAWRPMHGAPKDFHGFLDEQARDRLHDKLVEKIRSLADEVRAARAASAVSKGTASLAAGDVAAGEHSLFVASLITGRPAPALTAWVAQQYRIPADVLVAAVGRQPLPKLGLDRGHEIVIPAVPDHLKAKRQRIRRQIVDDDFKRRSGLMITGGIGPTQLDHDDAATTWGVGIAQHLAALIPIKRSPLAAGFGIRVQYGMDATIDQNFDMDALFAAGLLHGGLSLTPVVGFGGGGTVGHPEHFTGLRYQIPGAAYAEYGARASFTFRRPIVSLDATYTKTARTASAMPVEKRLDAHLTVKIGRAPLAFTFRYAEFDRAPDGFAAFGPDRAARMMWLLGGVGI